VKSIGIILAEHRSLAAVIHGLIYLVREIRERGATPDFALLGAMIYYIDAFPERYHHPKEDRYLFRLLRARCPEAAATLDDLSREHAEGEQRIRALEQALSRYQHGGAAEFPPFAREVERYAAMHWQHMHREESEVLPLAEKHLTPGDWEAIDAAFAGNTDPLFGATKDAGWEALFRRIVHLAPPPIGVGPVR
jgi:hemerythrin-like domain-containing protein